MTQTECYSFKTCQITLDIIPSFKTQLLWIYLWSPLKFGVLVTTRIIAMDSLVLCYPIVFLCWSHNFVIYNRQPENVKHFCIKMIKFIKENIEKNRLARLWRENFCFLSNYCPLQNHSVYLGLLACRWDFN